MKRVEMWALLCVGCLLGVEKRGRGWVEALDTTPLPCFLQEYDSMGVRWWGCAKDVILKGIMAIDERRGGAKGVGGSVWVRERVFLNAEFTESAEKKRGEAGSDGG